MYLTLILGYIWFFGYIIKYINTFYFIFVNYIGSITQFVRFFSKFERLFKKKMYNSIIQSIVHLTLWLFPFFWQIVDSIAKDLRRLGGQEWIKPIFDTLFWCEPYSSEDVLHRPE